VRCWLIGNCRDEPLTQRRTSYNSGKGKTQYKKQTQKTSHDHSKYLLKTRKSALKRINTRKISVSVILYIVLLTCLFPHCSTRVVDCLQELATSRCGTSVGRSAERDAGAVSAAVHQQLHVHRRHFRRQRPAFQQPLLSEFQPNRTGP